MTPVIPYLTDRYNNGTYNPNTHCEYIIDFDPKCDIVYCVQLDFSMNGGDSMKIRNLETSVCYFINHTVPGIFPNFVTSYTYLYDSMNTFFSRLSTEELKDPSTPD